MEDPLLHHPSTTSSPTTAAAAAAASSSSSSSILTRLTTIIILASLSFWANHEASKDFSITVLTSSQTSPSGRQFNLMFVSNGRASHLLHSASQSVQRTLFPDDSFPRKPVSQITLQLATHDLVGDVIVSPGSGIGEYVITLSPGVIAGDAVAAAVYRGVARVWLWDGEGEVPPGVVDAVVEYLVASAGYNAGAVGAGRELVGWCEERMPGFVARLNRGERERDDVLGFSPHRECDVLSSPTPVTGPLASPAVGDLTRRFENVGG